MCMGRKVWVSMMAMWLLAACQGNAQVNASVAQPGSGDSRVVSGAVRGNPEVEAQMQAIVAGNPVEDAEKALAAGDRSLWVWYQRGQKMVPGVANPPSGMTVKVPPGMGDTLYGKTQQDLRRQLLEYMRRYNERIMANHQPW